MISDKTKVEMVKQFMLDNSITSYDLLQAMFEQETYKHEQKQKREPLERVIKQDAFNYAEYELKRMTEYIAHENAKANIETTWLNVTTQSELDYIMQ